MVRVLLVIGARLYRESLASALSRDDDVTVVGAASERSEATASALRLKPDLVLLDAAIPDGCELVRALGSLCDDATRVVVIAIRDAPDSVIHWAEAGAAGFVSSEQSVDELVRTIGSAARGELICSPAIAASILERIRELGSSEDPEALRVQKPERYRLTGREQQIARLVSHGLSNKRIASELGISVATAKNHIHNLLGKLHVQRRSQVAQYVDSGARPKESKLNHSRRPASV